MSRLTDLKSLRAYFAMHSEMKDPVTGYLSSPKFTDALDVVEQDPRHLARLTIGLLQNVALDPNQGTRVEDFTKHPGLTYVRGQLADSDDSIFFNLRFHDVANFIGTFTLSKGAPEMPTLINAIRENLESPRFKAAQMHLRLQNKQNQRIRRFRKLGYAAMDRQVAQSKKHAPQFSASQEAERMAYEQEQFKLRYQAFDAAFNPLRARMENRLQAVKKATVSKAFQGSYKDMLIAFAYQYLVPRAPSYMM